MLGHCPMKFHSKEKNINDLPDDYDLCLCHKDYNHCVENNENGEIPEILPNVNLETTKYTETFTKSLNSNTNIYESYSVDEKTTQTPEVKQALGFEVKFCF